MPPPEVTVSFRGAGGKLEGKEEERRWPLATLMAYLFSGRECDEVRALLAVGEVTQGDLRITWAPVTLTVEEVSAVERTFPQADASRRLAMEEVSRAELVVPVEQPLSWVTLERAHPLVRDAASRAKYVRFDYGFWGDVYVTGVSPHEVATLLREAAIRARYTGGSALVRRLGGEAPPFLAAAPARRGCLTLPLDAWRSASWWRDAERWYRGLLTKGAGELGAGVRFVTPRSGMSPPWESAGGVHE